ncbi:uncharacterized protein LOC121406540 isoform X1 [Lytechinus variegatus]|uniref:uncharacterized protein LOC121406540 isoform X1 n=2 Tax=Lytechinus variegatus TaxID=7654 RepID=UPI001BB27184|nr:uncharacterized protein LOC121406540 isoform X1 [Lytechinus variegatus]
MSYLLAPFTAPLSNRQAIIRPMMMFGSAVMGVAISLASLASGVVGFSIAMFTSGAGYALVSLPSIVVCNRYFSKHFGVVVGITESGSALSLVFPLMTKMLLDATGLKGTILLLGGLSLNMVVCTAFLRDPRTQRKNGRRDKTIGQPRGTTCPNDADDRDAENECQLDMLSDSLSSGEDEKEQRSSECGCPQEDSTLLYRQKITHDRAGNDGELIQSNVAMQPTSARIVNGQIDSFQFESQIYVRTERTFTEILMSPFQWLWRFLDFSLCRDEPFLNFIYLSTFLFSMVHSAWYIFFVAHALAKGITLSNAVLINLVSGIGEGIGAFLQGPVTDRGWMTPRGMFMMFSLINSVVLFLDPLLSNTMLLTIAGFTNGLFLGGSLTLTSVMLKDTVSEDRFSTSYGLSSLTYGLAGPTGGLVAGWIASVADYEVTFVFLGGLNVAALLTMIPAYYHYDTKPKHRERGGQNDGRETPI